MMSEGTKNIVEAMKARGIRKVIGCMSGTIVLIKMIIEWSKWSEFVFMWLIVVKQIS